MKILKLTIFSILLGLLPLVFLSSCDADDVKELEDTVIKDDDAPVDDGEDDTQGENDDDTPVDDGEDDTQGENDDDPPVDDGDDDSPGENDDDSGVIKEYPYISGVSLQLFDGDDPLSDATPIFSYTSSTSVVLNPARSCQLKIGKDESTKWELNLLTSNIDVLTNNKCFNSNVEIKASDFGHFSWEVKLFQPGRYIPDKYSTEKWDGSQGSIKVTPSADFYTDPNYGSLPERVSFTFNNVRVGYYDDNGTKKAIRVHGVIEVTKHD